MEGLFGYIMERVRGMCCSVGREALVQNMIMGQGSAETFTIRSPSLSTIISLTTWDFAKDQDMRMEGSDPSAVGCLGMWV